jgi:hypothetical protein
VRVKTPGGTLPVRGGNLPKHRAEREPVFAFVFGHYLSLDRHGRRCTLNQTGKLFYILGSGAPVMRQTTRGDVNIILAAVSEHSVTVGARVYKIKGKAWPFYYGIQPSGRYPDQPFIRELITTAPSTRSFTACRSPRRRSSCRTCMTGDTTWRAMWSASPACPSRHRTGSTSTGSTNCRVSPARTADECWRCACRTCVRPQQDPDRAGAQQKPRPLKIPAGPADLDLPHSFRLCRTLRSIGQSGR